MALALCACGDGDDRSPRPAPETRDPSPAPAGDGDVRPDWLARLGSAPVITIFWTSGPDIDGDRVTVGSTAIGRVTVSATTGEVLGREPIEESLASPPDDPAEDLPPIRVGSAEIADQRLHLGSVEVPGRFVQRPGALGQSKSAVVALRVSAESRGPVVAPVWIDRAAGEVQAGTAIPGDGVVVADIAPAGVAAVIRFGRDLKRHQVAFWGPDGTLRWRWDLPEAQQARVDLSVAVAGDAVYVFYDGRDLARLPLESPTAAAGSADAGRAVLENPTP